MRQDVTFMNDLIEKRLASIVERPWARQLWAMKPNLSSARHIASSPSFQFQLGMLSRWACGNNKRYETLFCSLSECLKSPLGTAALSKDTGSSKLILSSLCLGLRPGTRFSTSVQQTAAPWQPYFYTHQAHILLSSLLFSQIQPREDFSLVRHTSPCY